MKVRAITGFFFIIVMLGSLLLGPYVFTGFYLLLALLCLYEFYGLVKQDNINPNLAVGLVNGLVFFMAVAIGFYLLPHEGDAFDFSGDLSPMNPFIFLPLLTVPLVFFAELYKKAEKPFTNIAYTLLGLVFAVVPFMLFHAMAYVDGEFNFHYPLAFLLMLWANDTGAYLVGSKFGRHRLFERHSPKKSWEGFIGGVLIAAGVGLILSRYYQEITWYYWMIMGVLIGCFGTMGDLVESMFKRSINVKDSGSILPGHGGLLDRFDGLLLAAPIVYAYLYFITNV